jgi:hypothetical protein
MKKTFKGLFGAFIVGLLAISGARAQAQLAPITIDNVAGTIVPANAVSSARQGAKPAASLDTIKTGQIRLGQVIPCVLPTPAGTGYFEQRAALLEAVKKPEFPGNFAVSRLKAEYVHDANNADGRQVVGVMRLVGPAGGKISAAGMRVWCELVGVAGSAISYEYGTLGYTDFRIGIDYGPDKARGTADDMVINTGDGSTMVDEIIFIGLGQSLNNSLAQVQAAFAANKTFAAKWFSQVKEPPSEFTPPEGDYSNISQVLDQLEGAPPPIVVGRSVKNPGNFPWDIYFALKPEGPFTRLNGNGVLSPGATLTAPDSGNGYFRFGRN